MKFQTIKIKKDVVVIGAGVAGVCCAIQAARTGVSVALIESRSCLGGNSSPERRVNVSGADGVQEYNFYAKETGIIEELRLENLYRNNYGNVYLWETVLIDCIAREKNIEVFLNTTIDEVNGDEGHINFLAGTQNTTEKRFEFFGHTYVDDTGDGTVGFLAGAEFHVGRESGAEYGEKIAPEIADDKVLLSTQLFYSYDTPYEVHFKKPDFAIDLTKTDVLQYRKIPDRSARGTQYGSYRGQWYYECGCGLDQVSDNETIMQQHRELTFGIWDYIKNSGKYDSDKCDLSYVSPLPSKREYRRLIGDYVLKEQDLFYQHDFDDAVGYGGWSIDLHTPEGFFSKDLSTKHYLMRGIYQIPYRTCYSKNVDNLFMIGRCMSSSHVAFGSTRLQATLATMGQAVGLAGGLCRKYSCTPRDIYTNHMSELQQELLKADATIIGKKNEDRNDFARTANIKVSSVHPCAVTESERNYQLTTDLALILPVKNSLDTVSILIGQSQETQLEYEIYETSKPESFNPEKLIASGHVVLGKLHDEWIDIPLNVQNYNRYLFIKLLKNEKISVGMSAKTLSGIITAFARDATTGQVFDYHTGERKKFKWTSFQDTLCFRAKQDVFNGENINNGYSRPYGQPNIWLSNGKIKDEFIEIDFDAEKEVHQINLVFDSNLNIHFPTFETNYPFDRVDRTVKAYDIYAKVGTDWKCIQQVKDNYQRVNRVRVEPIETSAIKIVFHETNGRELVGVYEVRVY